MTRRGGEGGTAAGPHEGRGEPGPRPKGERLAVLLPTLTGGGAERMLLRLAQEFDARGHAVDLVVTRVKGDHDRTLPAELEPVRLAPCSLAAARLAAARAAGRDWPHLVLPVLAPVRASWALRYLPALTAYLAERQPAALLSANSWPNLTALWARRLACARTAIVVSERIQLSERVHHLRRGARWRHLPGLIARFYPEAAAVTAVSEGVARDLAAATGLAPGRVRALPNPVVSADVARLASAPAPHPWLEDGGPPVVLGVGRLHPQKDFATLVAAFAEVRRDRPARLIVLGEGAGREALERQVRESGLEADVSLPGHVQNPFAFMSRSAVFALSSRYEGLPGVLIQALACGCPSVATDCPSGPREILRDGALGPLVPVGDARALAGGIRRCLDAPVPAATLEAAVAAYGVEAATDAYLEVLLAAAGRAGRP